MNANEALQKAQQLIDQRGRDYDHEGGERSMGAAVTAFNALTGHDLSEGDGWLLFELVKTKRSKSSPGHVDSNIDKISYSALRAEAELRDAKKPKYDEDAGLDAMDDPAFWKRECGIYEVRQAHPVAGSPPPQKFGCGKCKTEWRFGEVKPCERDKGVHSEHPLCDEGWIEHDGSDRCPVSDDQIFIETEGLNGYRTTMMASSARWPAIKRWRIAEVDGWVRIRLGSFIKVTSERSRFDIVFKDGHVRRSVPVMAVQGIHAFRPVESPV